MTGIMNAARRRESTGLKIVLALAALLYPAFILRSSFRIRGEQYFTLIDDAMISMRYARHLAQGQGLVWNIGEKPVQGFTNLGWTLFMACLHSFPFPVSKISLAVMIASGIVLLANILVVFGICRALQPASTFAALLAATVTAFYFPLVFWSLRGMEVGVLTLLVDLALLSAVRLNIEGNRKGFILFGLILAMALLVRLDVLLQLSLIIAYLFSGRKSNLRGPALAVLVVGLTTVAILWFQHAYFGDFLPNTYYQKMAGTSAWERIRNGVLVFYQHATRDTLLPALIAAAGMIFFKELRKRETFLLAGLFAVQCAYSVWVGGDYAEPEVDAANRFITQGMPALILLSSLAADRLLTGRLPERLSMVMQRPFLRSAAAIALGLTICLVISGRPWLKWSADNAPLLQADIRRTRLGLFIARNTSPAATIAVHAAGQIPYYSDRRTIDLLGLNDPVVAKEPPAGPFYPGHDKWDYEYSILQLKPDLIADNWIKLGSFMKDKSEYRKLENGIYIRRDSTLLNVDGLSGEYR
jgi:arabinofuranosyltransferase